MFSLINSMKKASLGRIQSLEARVGACRAERWLEDQCVVEICLSYSVFLFNWGGGVLFPFSDLEITFCNSF